MFQILFDHLFGHLPHRGTKIPTGPEVSSPGALLQQRELLEQLARTPALDPAHDFTRGHMRWRRDQDVHMILTHNAFQNLDLEDFAGLPDPFPHAERDVPSQDFLAVLRDPDTVILDVVNRVTAIAIVHSASPVLRMWRAIVRAQNCADEICPPQGGGLNLRFGKSISETDPSCIVI